MSKAIAIIDKPKSCEECVWCRTKYSLPLSTQRKGLYCQLKEPKDRIVEDFDYDAEVHLSNCPLRELPQKIDEAIGTSNMFKALGWNECIDEIMRGSEAE